MEQSAGNNRPCHSLRRSHGRDSRLIGPALLGESRRAETANHRRDEPNPAHCCLQVCRTPEGKHRILRIGVQRSCDLGNTGSVDVGTQCLSERMMARHRGAACFLMQPNRPAGPRGRKPADHGLDDFNYLGGI